MIEWEPPGAGMWQLETTHLRGAQPRVLQERAIRGFGDGFATPARAYGLPIDHVEVRFVNDHCYGRIVAVGAPEPKVGKVGKAPPGVVLWLLARLHPTTYYVRDDNVALTFMWPAGLVRRALLEAGTRLTARGGLDERDHVLALGEAEIAAALDGDRTLRAVAAARVARGRAAEARGAPVMLGDDEGPPPDPKIFPAAMAELIAAALVPLELEQFGVGSPPAPADGYGDGNGEGHGEGHGVGTTAYTGRACVAVVAEEALDRLRRGDVLVTTHTTPAYEAVMPIAGAVVTEDGGLMSHAALVCREYGIPAVLGVSNATALIPNGVTVTVDPVTGRVLVLDESAETREVP